MYIPKWLHIGLNTYIYIYVYIYIYMYLCLYVAIFNVIHDLFFISTPFFKSLIHKQILYNSVAFLVACICWSVKFGLSFDPFFSSVLRDATPRFVGLSVCPSVRTSVGPSVCLLVCPSHFTFSGFFGSLPSQFPLKWWSVLNWGLGSPARDWGSLFFF